MNDKLVFRGYASRDLDQVEANFVERFGSEPAAFVVQPDFVVYGSRKNHDKIVKSRFGGFAAVYVPIRLTREEVINLDAERTSAPIRREVVTAEPDERAMLWDETIRYCFYCGQIFKIETESDRIYCDKPACAQRHFDRLAANKAVRAEYTRPKINGGGGASASKPAPAPEIEDRFDVVELPVFVAEPDPEPMPSPTEQEPFDDSFTLDDPYTDLIEGWVYLIEAETGLYKLGRSNDVWQRFSTLVHENAASLTMRHAIRAANYIQAELWLHTQFAKKRHHGEWFSLSQDEIEWFCSLADGALDGVGSALYSL